MADRVLWPDTNVTRRTGQFMALVRTAAQKGVHVSIHAQVFLETRRHRQSEKGPDFDARMFDGLFAPLAAGSSVMARFHELTVDLDRARRWSEALVQRYPTDEAWQAVKREALRASGGTVGESRNVPMTADWWIALSIEENPDAWMVTEDQGPEWNSLRDRGRVLSLNEATAWLSEQSDQVQ